MYVIYKIYTLHLALSIVNVKQYRPMCSDVRISQLNTCHKYK